MPSQISALLTASNLRIERTTRGLPDSAGRTGTCATPES